MEKLTREARIKTCIEISNILPALVVVSSTTDLSFFIEVEFKKYILPKENLYIERSRNEADDSPEKESQVPIGEGMIDWPEFIKAARVGTFDMSLSKNLEQEIIPLATIP